MILPSMGVVSELVTCFSRKVIFGYGFIAISSLAIAVLGFLVWGHHMFLSGQSVYASLIFSVLSFLVAIPSAVKVFNWTATLYKGSVSFEAPMIYALGFIGLFTIGGLTGLFLATLGFDVHVHDTYFVVAHFHYIMVGGAIMGYLGGIHFWWPKISGRMYPEWPARIGAAIIFIGFNLTFFPQFIAGYLGMPRRYHMYPPEFQVLNVMSTAGATILGVGYLLPLTYLLWSLRYGKVAPANPWGATGLEWQTPSPPPTENFATTPVVTEEAYAYSDHARAGSMSSQAASTRARTRTRTSSTAPSTSTVRRSSACGCSSRRRSCSSAGSSSRTPCIASRTRQAFAQASHHLDVTLGCFNTAVLIGSSLTMALAVHGAQLGRRWTQVVFLHPHDRARLDLPRRQDDRVRPQVPRAPGARGVRSSSRATPTPRSSSRSTS